MFLDFYQFIYGPTGGDIIFFTLLIGPVIFAIIDAIMERNWNIFDLVRAVFYFYLFSYFIATTFSILLAFPLFIRVLLEPYELDFIERLLIIIILIPWYGGSLLWGIYKAYEKYKDTSGLFDAFIEFIGKTFLASLISGTAIGGISGLLLLVWLIFFGWWLPFLLT